VAITPPPTAKSDLLLTRLLSEEISKLDEFINLLKREQDFLSLGDIESLLPLVDNKTVLANELATFAQARERQLADMGLTVGRNGMEAWLTRLGQTGPRQAWQKLLDLASAARTLNETNGKLIALNLQHNQKALVTLMAATNRAMNYGPDGQQQTDLGGRILGKA
jgi:flagellar biosynthesis/type III secretory pathway chaperone